MLLVKEAAKPSSPSPCPFGGDALIDDCLNYKKLLGLATRVSEQHDKYDDPPPSD